MAQRFVSLFFSTLLMLGFSGCGEGFRAASQFSSSQLEPIGDNKCISKVTPGEALKNSTFAQKKVWVTPSPLNPASAFGKANVSDGLSSIDVVVDASCLDTNEDHRVFLGKDLSLENTMNLKKRFSATLEFSVLPPLASIESEANSNPCVVGVADSGEVHASQVKAAAANDPNIAEQRHLERLNFSQSYQYFFEGNRIQSTTVVAVLDTGIDYNHPDLSCNMWPTLGADFINDDDDPMDDDPFGHGTHVAGLIGACRNNGIGGAGVMPLQIQLMAVKVLGAGGGGQIGQVVNGILYAVENGADVINLSLEAPGARPQMRDALEFAVANGVTVVVAAGNSGMRLDSGIPANQVSPAMDSDIQGLITVGSLDVIDNEASEFSNFSTEYVEISAPGSFETNGAQQVQVGLLSTRVGGGYQRVSGTSQATPLVAGTIGLIIGYFKSEGTVYTPASLENFLLNNAVESRGVLAGVFKGGAALDLGVLAENVRIAAGEPEIVPPVDCP